MRSSWMRTSAIVRSLGLRRLSTAAAAAPTAESAGGFKAGTAHAQGNVPPSVLSKIGRNLHLKPQHPIQIIKSKIERYFSTNYINPQSNQPLFQYFDRLPPVVTTKQNFDELLIPTDHVSRRLSDTFYLDANRVLRTHTSAHQNDLLRAGNRAFLVTGDCYRRDQIDATHYPTFHQMEGVRVWKKDGSDALIAPTKGVTISSGSGSGGVARVHTAASDAALHAAVTSDFVIRDLKGTLEGMIRHVFGSVDMRWIDAYFPFTEPSLELEIHFGGKWLEVLGSGAIHSKLLAQCGMNDYSGWAFGIGLERLAMVLYDIPDIRLFWTEDERFIKQFAKETADPAPAAPPTTPISSISPAGPRKPNNKQKPVAAAAKPLKFKPYSFHDPSLKDISFWLNPGAAVAPLTDSSPTSTGATGTSTVPTDSAIAASGSGANGDSFHDNDLYSIVRDVAGDLVESVHLIDTFTHPKTKRESRCYRVTYRHFTRILTTAEVNEFHNVVRARLATRKDLELR